MTNDHPATDKQINQQPKQSASFYTTPPQVTPTTTAVSAPPTPNADPLLPRVRRPKFFLISLGTFIVLLTIRLIVNLVSYSDLVMETYAHLEHDDYYPSDYLEVFEVDPETVSPEPTPATATPTSGRSHNTNTDPHTALDSDTSTNAAGHRNCHSNPDFNLSIYANYGREDRHYQTSPCRQLIIETEILFIDNNDGSTAPDLSGIEDFTSIKKLQIDISVNDNTATYIDNTITALKALSKLPPMITFVPMGNNYWSATNSSYGIVSADQADQLAQIPTSIYIDVNKLNVIQPLYSDYYTVGLEDEISEYAAYQRVIDQIMAAIPADASDLDKVTYLAGWLAQNVTYDFGNVEERADLSMAQVTRNWIEDVGAFNDARTLYETLVNRQAICVGYANTMSNLLEIAGIPSKYVFGASIIVEDDEPVDGGGHVWNQVLLDGKWYNLDVTAMATGGALDYIEHPYNYYLVSDEVYYYGVYNNASILSDFVEPKYANRVWYYHYLDEELPYNNPEPAATTYGRQLVLDSWNRVFNNLDI